jgi:hypothetical protein
MKANSSTADEAIVECLAIIERCSGATGTGRYADGYRAAAADIRAGIEARFGVREIGSWERDLQEVEIEARTLSRVIGLLRRQQASSSSAAIRRVLGDVITAIDDGDVESTLRLTRDAG